LIKLFSFKGDTVLDPFNGSGTTTAVARALGREGIGFDVEEKYCAHAAKRTQAIEFASDCLPARPVVFG
jgi:DNA modification methylase